jgi:hypothetical protein
MLVKLKFVNRSRGVDIPDVLIFQKNVATDLEEAAVAWKVIRNCGPNTHHPFVFSTDLEIGIGDEYGNFSPRIKAGKGRVYAVSATVSGRRFAYKSPGNNNSDICIRNDLPRGAINANVYLDDKILATKTAVAPGQKALFQFKPTIWVGVRRQLVQGDVIDSAIVNAVNTEISLLGIASATIVMTGGGPGVEANPYTFTLEDVAHY